VKEGIITGKTINVLPQKSPVVKEKDGKVKGDVGSVEKNNKDETEDNFKEVLEENEASNEVESENSENPVVIEKQENISENDNTEEEVSSKKLEEKQKEE